MKGRFETVGLDDSARYDECKSSFKARIPCLADWAQAEGEYIKNIFYLLEMAHVDLISYEGNYCLAFNKCSTQIYHIRLNCGHFLNS